MTIGERIRAATDDGYEADSFKLEEARMEREAQFHEDMNELREIQKERDKMLLEADGEVLKAIQTASAMMNSLQAQKEDEKIGVAMCAAELGQALAALRESMTQKHYPAGPGWTV